MISSGLVNALVAWAGTDATRLAQLVAERDALIAALLSGGKASLTVVSGGANGKSATAHLSLSREDKLSLLTAVLTQLGAIEVTALLPTTVFADFRGAQR